MRGTLGLFDYQPGDHGASKHEACLFMVQQVASMGNHNILSDALLELVVEVVGNMNSALTFYLYKKRPEPPLS